MAKQSYLVAVDFDGDVDLVKMEIEDDEFYLVKERSDVYRIISLPITDSVKLQTMSMEELMDKSEDI